MYLCCLFCNVIGIFKAMSILWLRCIFNTRFGTLQAIKMRSEKFNQMTSFLIVYSARSSIFHKRSWLPFPNYFVNKCCDLARFSNIKKNFWNSTIGHLIIENILTLKSIQILCATLTHSKLSLHQESKQNKNKKRPCIINENK